MVKVGAAGLPNFKRHRGSKQCLENQKKRDKEERGKKEKEKGRNLMATYFSGPRKAPVPSTVPTPPLLTPMPRSRAPKPSRSLSNLSPGQPQSNTPDLPNIPCENAAKILSDFRARIDSLPETVPIAPPDHPLARFSGDPTGSVPDGEDAWEIWNPQLDTILQRSPDELRSLVVRGEHGLHGLCSLLEYLARYHGIGGGLLEGKVMRLMNAMNEV